MAQKQWRWGSRRGRSLNVESGDQAFLPLDFLFLLQVETHLSKPKWASCSSHLGPVLLASILLLHMVILFLNR